MAKNEPQSYGSQKEWVTGKTGQNVNDPKSEPAPEHAEFYDSSREAETQSDDQGGKVSPQQLADNAQAGTSITTGESAQPISKVSTQDGGAKRGGYFKDRDYK